MKKYLASIALAALMYFVARVAIIMLHGTEEQTLYVAGLALFLVFFDRAQRLFDE